MKKLLAIILILLTFGIGIAGEILPIPFAFTGRWQPAADPVLIDDLGLQDIQNMRRSGKHYKGIAGHTIINSTSISAAPVILNGFHFRKDQPQESHVIVVAADSTSPTASYLYRNTTAVPSAGNFSGTILHTDAAVGIGKGRFSNAPAGNMVYANGAETLIWGGNESLPTSFITSTDSLTGTASLLTNPNDYTDQIRNTRQTADQVALVGGGIDAYTVLLLHGNGADESTTFTDSETTPKSVTSAGSTQIDTAQYKFATGSILFDGTGDYLTTADHSDWNMADGKFTIDFWVRFNELPEDGESMILFSQSSDADNSAVFSLGYTAVVGGNEYPEAQSSDYVLATSSVSTATNAPYFATDPAKSLTGSATSTTWVSETSATTNQRFHIDIGTAAVVTRIYYENYHDSGGDTDKGVQNFTLWGSNGTGIIASGGSITYSGGYKIHTFTSSGTFSVTRGGDVEYLVVAGGGGGGGKPAATSGSGGGGAGGMRTGTLAVTSQPYSITVGGGGTGGAAAGAVGTKGTDSTFATVTSEGGGYGGGTTGGGSASGGTGGSGGGSDYNATKAAGTSGQGSAGGAGCLASGYGGGGGGGKSAVGADGAINSGGKGGNGTASSISGSSVSYAGGGGGGIAVAFGTGGAGGTGGGGGGGTGTAGTNGTANTGGGGGGASGGAGGNGGSGIVIIRYAHDAVFTTLTYGTDTGWTQLATSQNSFDEHAAADAADPKYIDVTNPTAYRYYAIKCVNNYGDATSMGLRHVVLLSETTPAVSSFTLSLKTAGETATPINAVEWPSGAVVNTWYHIALIRGWGGVANSWTVTLNGTNLGVTTLATTYPDVAAALQIGSGATGIAFNGWIDELRISKGVARWVANFVPPTFAYRTGSSYWVVGSMRPLQGVKFYVSEKNTTTSTIAAKEWNGVSWTTLTVTDNTSLNGVTLAQTETVKWASTVDSSKVKYISGLSLYWYQFSISSGSATIYYTTVDAPMQEIRNIWNGSESYVGKCLKYNGTTFIDYTDEVNDEDATNSYADFSSMTTAHYILLGFPTPQQGFNFTFVAGQENSTAATTMTISYWDGQAWTATSALSDGTATTTTAFSKGGTASFQSPGGGVDFARAISDEVPLFYYKITFATTLDAAVKVGEIRGIAAPPAMAPYKFSETFRNRLFLFNEAHGDKNKTAYSGENTPDIFNGWDSGYLYFGDNTELIAAAQVYNIFRTAATDQLIIMKKNETYRLAGDDPSTWLVQRMSANIGCVAPLSVVVCDVAEGSEEGIKRQVVVWQSDKGFVLSDGAAVVNISSDIECYFDPLDSRYIPTARRSKTVAWYDTSTGSYKALISSGATALSHNIELEYSLKSKEWTKIIRANASGADPLQSGFQVFDTDGLSYTYGGNSGGYLYRLENGSTFAGTAITQILHTKDMILDSQAPLFRKSTVKHMRTVLKKKTGGGSITVAHYGDQVLTVDGTSNQAVPDAINMATAPYNTQSCALGPALYHSLKFTLSGSTISGGMELTGLGLWVEPFTAIR